MAGIGYTNGAAPNSALVFIDGIHNVPSIAPRVNALIAYARTQGRIVRVAHWYGGYRNLHEQGQLSGTGNSGSTIPVAVAGKSTHGVYAVGRVDLVGKDGFSYTVSDLAWIVANAGKFGLVREFGSADPNHFMASGAFTPEVPAPPVAVKEDNMPLIDTVYAIHRGTFYIVHGAGCDAIPLVQRDVWNQRVLGLVDKPWDDANIPSFGAYLTGRPTDGAPDQQSNDTLLVAWLAGRGIPVIPTPEKPYRFSDSVPAPVPVLTPEQLAAIGRSVQVPTPDLSALTTAIAALDKQADDYQAQLLATLAKGLTISGTAVPGK